MLAAIDVGSNTIRMLIGNAVDGQVRPVLYRRAVTRLKGGQTGAGLASEAMQRTLAALDVFQQELHHYSPEKIAVVGTEAMRSASNADQFTTLVQQQTGLDLQVIPGDQEAIFSARGALSVVDPVPEIAVIVDIGGGSTEIVLAEHHNIIFRHSCPLGVVRLAEMQQKPTVRNFIESNLEELSALLLSQGMHQLANQPGTSIVGTAGTITTLAALDLEMATYDWRRVNNHRMTVDRLFEIEQQLAALDIVQREQLPGMEEGRGDLILPGLAILNGLMNLFAMRELIVSDFGLLEGLLLHMAEMTAIR